MPASAAAPAALSLDHVTKSYNGAPVLHQLSLEIKSGQIYALLGPSGCGKLLAVHCSTQLQAVN